MKSYKFKAKVWKYKGAGGWHFVTLPKLLSKEIRKYHLLAEEGWGRMPAMATIGTSKWETAIWFDSKRCSYLLPIKAKVRKEQCLAAGSIVAVRLAVPEPEQRLRRLVNW